MALTDNRLTPSRIYVDTRLHHMLDFRIKQSFWNLGDFPRVVQDGLEAVILGDPWANATDPAPFDQRMFATLAVIAVLSPGTNSVLCCVAFSFFVDWLPGGKRSWNNQRFIS
jgi:hypothetical protein